MKIDKKYRERSCAALGRTEIRKGKEAADSVG